MKIPATKNEAVDQSLEKWRDIRDSKKKLGEIAGKCGLCYYSYQKELFHISSSVCLVQCDLAKKHGACNKDKSICSRIYMIVNKAYLECYYLDELKMHKDYAELKTLIEKMIEQLGGLKNG